MRINNQHRERILKNIIMEKLTPRLDAMKASKAGVFNAIVDHSIKKAQFKPSMFAGALPGLFATETYLYLSNFRHEPAAILSQMVPRYRSRTDPVHPFADWSLGELQGPGRFIPFSLSQNSMVDVSPGDVPELDAYVEAVRVLLADLKNIKEAARPILWGCNTLKQLVDRWPEGTRYFPEDVQGAAVTPPAIKTDALNALLGL